MEKYFQERLRRSHAPVVKALDLPTQQTWVRVPLLFIQLNGSAGKGIRPKPKTAPEKSHLNTLPHPSLCNEGVHNVKRFHRSSLGQLQMQNLHSSRPFHSKKH